PEALPEVVALALGQSGPRLLVRLPAREDVIDGGADLLPLGLGRVLRGQLLRLHDQRGAIGDRLIERGPVLGLLLLGDLADGATEGFEAASQRFEIADRVGRHDGCEQGVDGLRDIRPRRSTLDALLEEGHLAGEVDVLALEVGDRLFSRAIGILADGTFPVALAYIDGARLVDATPWCLVVVRQSLTLLPGPASCDRPAPSLLHASGRAISRGSAP